MTLIGAVYRQAKGRRRYLFSPLASLLCSFVAKKTSKQPTGIQSKLQQPKRLGLELGQQLSDGTGYRFSYSASKHTLFHILGLPNAKTTVLVYDAAFLPTQSFIFYSYPKYNVSVVIDLRSSCSEILRESRHRGCKQEAVVR